MCPENVNVIGGVSRVSGTAVVVSVVAGIILQLLPPAFAGRLVSEGGVVESVSALLYAIGVLLVLVQLKLRPSRLWLSGLAVVLWLLLRELDLQTAFTYRSIESMAFYTHPIAPWWQKALAILALAPFVAAGLHLFGFTWRNIRGAFARRESWVGDLIAIAVLGLSASLSEKVLEMTAIEETCELGMAFVVLRLIWAAKSRPGDAAGGVDKSGVKQTLDQ